MLRKSKTLPERGLRKASLTFEVEEEEELHIRRQYVPKTRFDVLLTTVFQITLIQLQAVSFEISHLLLHVIFYK